MVGRLKERINQWRLIGASGVVQDWLLYGVNLPLLSFPEPYHGVNAPTTEEQEIFVDKDNKECLAAGAIVEAPPGIIPHIVSPIKVAPKKGPKKWRKAINLRYLNTHVRCEKFKLEGHNDVPFLLNRNDWMFSLDFKSGYYHVSLHPNTKPFFGFYWKGKYYYFVVLPFGLNIAPHVFTEVVKQVLRFWRQQGIRVIGYFDDLLFFASSFEAAKKLMEKVVMDLEKLGWVIAWEKSMRVPAQKAVSLGLEIDSVKGLIIFNLNLINLIQVFLLSQRIR